MKKILVIEDESLVLENTMDLLELEGYFPIGASNGVIGVELAQKEAPDLILCDVMMPELDGYGVLSALMQNPATAQIPLVFVTARVDEADRRKGLEAGAKGYLTKPFTAQQLLEIIAAQLS